MDITPVISETRQLIQRYGGGSFTIANREYAGPVLVLPDRTIPLEISAFEDIDEKTLSPLLTSGEEIRILLIGSGRTQRFVSPELRDALRGHGIVAECMDTGAACRTFNILLAEERRVAAALLVI